MTIKQLALFLGVSEAAVKAWRSGRRKPTGPAKRLLDILALVEQADPLLYACLLPKEAKQPEPAKVYPLLAAEAKPPKPIPREPAPYRLTYTLAAFHAGEYDALIGTMEDEQYEAWRASLV